MKEKVLGAGQAVLIALVILTGSIALPILFRPFFYWHIAPLNLTEQVGLTAAQVKTAYNQMMDFCIGLTDTFSAGVLDWSEAGREHFVDVRKLFVLDLRVLAGASALLAVIALLRRRKPVRLGNRTPGFWGSVGLGAAFLTVGGLAALDFDRAFVVFHQLFFPGKDNWLFDGQTDPIIYMLPSAFFRNCAILILATVLVSCGVLIMRDLLVRRK